MALQFENNVGITYFDEFGISRIEYLESMKFKDTQLVKKTEISGCNIQGDISYDGTMYDISVHGTFHPHEVNELIKKLKEIVKSNG